MSVCSCDEPSTPAAPASLPQPNGREMVPQAVWVELQDGLLPQIVAQEALSAAAVVRREKEELASPQRLSVLYCALLN